MKTRKLNKVGKSALTARWETWSPNPGVKFQLYQYTLGSTTICDRSYHTGKVELTQTGPTIFWIWNLVGHLHLGGRYRGLRHKKIHHFAKVSSWNWSDFLTQLQSDTFSRQTSAPNSIEKTCFGPKKHQIYFLGWSLERPVGAAGFSRTEFD